MNKTIAGYRATRAAMLAAALQEISETDKDRDVLEVLEDTIVYLNETMEHYTQIKTGEIKL